MLSRAFCRATRRLVVSSQGPCRFASIAALQEKLAKAGRTLDPSLAEEPAYLEHMVWELEQETAPGKKAKSIELPLRLAGTYGAYANGLWLAAAQEGEARLNQVHKEISEFHSELNTPYSKLPKAKQWARFNDPKAYDAFLDASVGEAEKNLQNDEVFKNFTQQKKDILAGKLSPSALPDDFSPLHQFLNDRSQSVAEKRSVVENQLKHLDPLVYNLLQTLISDGTLRFLPRIINGFETIQRTYKQEMTGTIITATPLTKPQRKKFETVLKSVVGKDASVVISDKVDPALLGGFRAVLDIAGDLKYVDLSAATQFDSVKSVVAANVDAAI